ncbi:AMP-binding protein, partial [Cupriavidus basilensis]|uniref:AMP-binding protein n=1 Tax=Cupriavidus basilensis TaxID=68895 RepID=UPI0005BA1D32
LDSGEVRRILAGLHDLQCKEGDTIAAMLRNSPEYVALVLACRQAGLYLASINWHFKALEANHILTDSGARALVVDADLLEQVREGIPAGVSVILVSRGAAPPSIASPGPQAHHWANFGAGLPAMPPRAGASHGAIAYTSGTTG